MRGCRVLIWCIVCVVGAIGLACPYSSDVSLLCDALAFVLAADSYCCEVLLALVSRLLCCAYVAYALVRSTCVVCG